MAPIQTIKHFVHLSQGAIAANTMFNLDVVHAVSVASVGAATDEVEEGSIVKAVYVELWITNNGSAGINNSFNITVVKKMGSDPDMTQAQAANLASYQNKKNILYTTQGIFGSASSGNTVPILRTWIMIPKGKQRFGLDDRLMVNISNIGATTMERCGIFIFKEYK